jgi:choline-glycine betaine transporter
MEMLLNLAWLLLVLPAYWLWQRSRSAGKAEKFRSLQIAMALACTLVILFPVVSATDDLHVMRAEIEESPCNKRSVRASATDKTSASTLRWQAPPALAENLRMFAPGIAYGQVARAQAPSIPVEPPVEDAGRAPPASLA